MQKVLSEWNKLDKGYRDLNMREEENELGVRSELGIRNEFRIMNYELFHVEHFFIQDGCPPRSASLCHSEEPATKNLCASSYSRSYSRRIPAEEMESVFRLKLRLANPVQRFFADAQNDKVKTKRNMRRPV